MSLLIKNKIYEKIIQNKREKKKSLAILLDPDKTSDTFFNQFLNNVGKISIDYIFIGGSLVVLQKIKSVIKKIRATLPYPIILFPGSPNQISPQVDATLFLSLISGRNPELLIGQHVLNAYQIKQSKVEVISTGYILIDGGKPTSVSYISNTLPIPNDKNDIAVSTAIAGELLGLKMIFLDAGSGALTPVNDNMVKAVSQNVDLPLIVGGGIRSTEKIKKLFAAGADIVVLGNIIEKNVDFLLELSQIKNN